MIDGPFAETKELVAELFDREELLDGRGRRVGQAVARESRSSSEVLDIDDFGDFAAEIKTCPEERSRAELRQLEIVTSATQQAIDAVWRMNPPGSIAGRPECSVIGRELAGDLAQDALVAALEQWPESGIPENPGGWLMPGAPPRRRHDPSRHPDPAKQRSNCFGRELTVIDEDADGRVIEFDPMSRMTCCG